MGGTYNSGSSSIVGSVTTTQTLPSLPTGATQITKYIANANTGTTIYTVTAGKTFYCFGVTLSCNSATEMGLSVAATQVLSGQVTTAASVVFTGGIVFTATAGQAITISGIGAAENSASIWGYEV